MNNTEEQEQLLNEFGFVRVHLQLKQNHLDYLRTIDPDNQSKAARIVIDVAMNRTHMDKIRQILLYVLFGICLITLAILILNMF